MVHARSPDAAFVRFMEGRGAGALASLGRDPSALDTDAVLRLVDQLSPWFGGPRAWFPLDARGFEHVPSRPSLVVSNHSGGTSIPDAWGLGVSWYRHFGASRPIHALAHDMVFALRATAVPFARLGVLRAGRDVARSVLVEHGHDLVVMPGGDLDTWRPHKDRYKVRFSGRMGYARLAIANQVPVVPVAHAGAHDTLVVLTDGRWLARRMRLPQLFRAEVFPVHLSLPFGLAIGPLPHLPPPTTLRYRFCPAVAPPPHEPGAPLDEGDVRAFDAEVRHRMQAALDGLRDATPPLRERLRQRIHRVRAGDLPGV